MKQEIMDHAKCSGNSITFFKCSIKEKGLWSSAFEYEDTGTGVQLISELYSFLLCICSLLGFGCSLCCHLPPPNSKNSGVPCGVKAGLLI